MSAHGRFLLLVWLLTAAALLSGCSSHESDDQVVEGSQVNARALKALPYLDWNPIDPASAKADGVVKYDVEKASPGYNLYNSRPRSRAVLMDMAGQEVHAWEQDVPGGWHHIEMARDGALYTILKDRSLSKLDWDSHLLWSLPLRAHHDVALADNGEVYVLVRSDEELELAGRRLPIIDDYVQVLSSDGHLLRHYSMARLFANRLGEGTAAVIEKALHEDERAARAPGGACDVFHVNSIELVRGGLLISVRELDLIALVDLEQGKLLWTWGPGQLEQQHQPTMTASGTVLVFDNGTRREYSRIVEYAPDRGEVVWEYTQGPGGNFYSSSRGGVEGLPNGDVLVTESNKGHVFEVDREGEIVWEFYNPERRNDERAAIYRLARLDAQIVEPLLQR
jgi:hypothetical protein